MLEREKIIPFDERRSLIILKDRDAAIDFSVQHLENSCKRAIQKDGKFTIALSGGSTPRPIFERFSLSSNVEWEKIWLFWGDERAVPSDHKESNFKMAMDAGFERLPIPKSQIHRMIAEKEIEKHAREYEELLRRVVGNRGLHLVILGMGEDGHTVSLFPKSSALKEEKRLVVSTDTTQGMRMTLTYPCLSQSRQATFHVFGKSKAKVLKEVLNASIDSPWPSSRVGTVERPALWILDEEAASFL